MSIGAAPNLSGGLSMDASGPDCQGGGGGNGGGGNGGGGGSCPLGGGLPGIGGGLPGIGGGLPGIGGGFGGGFGAGGGGIGVWSMRSGGPGASVRGFWASSVGGVVDRFLGPGPGGSLWIPGGFGNWRMARAGMGGGSGGSVLVPMWTDTDAACAPPPGLPVPPAPPQSGNAVGVKVEDQLVGSIPIVGLRITCVDTGVSLTSTCGGVTFFQYSAGIKTFATPGGSGTRCNDGSIHMYQSGSASGFAPGAVNILVLS